MIEHTVEDGVAFQDDFSAGFRHEGPDARWRVRPSGALPAGDGVVRTSSDGVVVEPPGVDPVTGEPAFARPATDGPTEHIRWAAFAASTSAAGWSGFDVAPGSRFGATMAMSAQFFGLDKHDLGAGVDPDSDLRLGMAGMICVDLESGLVFDFVLTRRRVYALYERLPRPGLTHAAFSYAVPVAVREPDRFHDFEVRLDADRAVVRWRLDGADVLAVDRIGLRCLDPEYLKKDEEGPESEVLPRQLALGFGLFTDRLFGQGARLRARHARVTVA
ncbi:hypothetical protein FHX81_7519 [Saccharothrix saharensis]|uniref:Uncharacterized protein n=1 Tax=Saccharothrix saharensis TaxID=571190 RepID=A0A543JQE3_9PSEU|nr:DUF6081 family protein [Saccharothrix saharensis]TQM85050.1 hypothetical protein FHX81_7519 [Saccharothrix saharensis]